jgi:hypothetical protein
VAWRKPTTLRSTDQARLARTIYILPMFIRPPYNRPTSLIRTRDDRLVLRIESEQGERMATRLRPMTLLDALRGLSPRFISR